MAFTPRQSSASGDSASAIIKPTPSLSSQNDLTRLSVNTSATSRPSSPPQDQDPSEDESESSDQSQDDTDIASDNDDSDTEDSGTELARPPKSLSPSPSPERRPVNVIGGDPLSHLSSLERTILIAVHNNTSISPGGVPITLIAKGLAGPRGPTVDEMW